MEMFKILDPTENASNHSVVIFFWLALHNWRYKLNTQSQRGLDVLWCIRQLGEKSRSPAADTSNQPG